MERNVSIDEIMNRLHISRTYIYHNVLPNVRHKKMVQNRILVDEKDLRRWLVESSVFSRQTKFVSTVGFEADEYYAMLTACGMMTECPPQGKRSRLPFQRVRPFDYWDMELIFSDDPRFSNKETLYRIMYLSAAVKIQLGDRKSIFVAPALNDVLRDKEEALPEFHVRDINSRTGKIEPILFAELVPAMDYEKEAEYRKKQAKNPLTIQINGESGYVRKVRNILAETGVYAYNKGIEETESNAGRTLTFKIPQPSVDAWKLIVEDTRKRLAEYDDWQAEFDDIKKEACQKESANETNTNNPRQSPRLHLP